ncbi:MAG: HAMP domain-containing histidine kinase [Gemmatimonadetes bacterium]|jgi:signal transduction histidine kinase|nr:HAMP domain-containing histidine kinase [Gemmatimonadota bacterium]MBT7598618.1 HAMP domain-containing histidine kinase [Gemmatimonadota bacterium]
MAATNPTASRVATRLFPLLLAVAALPVLAIAAVSFISGLDLVRNVATRRTGAVVALASAHVGEQLGTVIRESSMVPRSLEVRRFLRASDAPSSPTQADSTSQDLNNYLDYFLGATQIDYLQIVLLDAQGNVVARRRPGTTGPRAGATTASDEQTSIDTVGRPLVGQRLRFSRIETISGAILRVTQSVHPRRGTEVLGFVLLDIDATTLLPAYGDDEISLFAIGSQGEVLLQTTSETVAQVDLINQIPPREAPEQSPVIGGKKPSDQTRSARRIGAAKEASDTRRPKPNRILWTRDDAEHLAVYRHLALPPWTVVAYMNAEPYTSRARANGQRTLVMTAAFLIVAGGLLFALVRRVRQRTHELENANVALEEANLQVQEANRLKSEFLARMSHDLRTPMNAIIGYTRILLRRSKDSLEPRQFRNLENIRTSADNLLGLINDILDLSRIEAGRVVLSEENTDLRPLIEACVTSVAPLVADGVELKREIDDLSTQHLDPERLRRVLMNLLGNAVKFTDSGSIVVALESTPNGFELSVTDTGIGIPPEDLPHVFDEFRQVDGIAKAQQGTGLGLSIARKSIELMGGTVEATSVIGQGSTFTISLPTSA